MPKPEGRCHHHKDCPVEQAGSTCGEMSTTMISQALQLAQNGTWITTLTARINAMNRVYIAWFTNHGFIPPRPDEEEL